VRDFDLLVAAPVLGWNCQVNWIRSPVWVPPRSEKAQIIAAYELAPTKLIATDGKFSELSINLSIPSRAIRRQRAQRDLPRLGFGLQNPN